MELGFVSRQPLKKVLHRLYTSNRIGQDCECNVLLPTIEVVLCATPFTLVFFSQKTQGQNQAPEFRRL
jgi:hypothetical protein